MPQERVARHNVCTASRPSGCSCVSGCLQGSTMILTGSKGAAGAVPSHPVRPLGPCGWSCRTAAGSGCSTVQLTNQHAFDARATARQWADQQVSMTLKRTFLQRAQRMMAAPTSRRESGSTPLMPRHPAPEASHETLPMATSPLLRHFAGPAQARGSAPVPPPAGRPWRLHLLQLSFWLRACRAAPRAAVHALLPPY